MMVECDRRALVCAINRRISVGLFQTLKSSAKIYLDLGNHKVPIDNLTAHSDFRFVLDAVKQYLLGQGIERKIELVFSNEIGFCPLSAVTVDAYAV